MSLKILLVEKDITITDLFVPSLERKGYEVTVARTQRKATSHVRTSRPDVLVMDVASFGASGYKVSESVRSRLDGVPVILLLPEGHASAGSSADAFMIPPFTSRKLLYRVRKVAEKVTSHKIQIGPLTLDPDARTLYKGGDTKHLHPKEAALLEMFMENHGRVLSRQEIMKKVWETDYMGDTRTLSVHVRWLREKIEDDPSRPRYLRTVRGVGYRFEVPGATA